MRKSITLVELIISMTLFGVIILGAVAFHLSSERFLSSSENSTEVLNDLTFILQHINKNSLLATGDINNVGISVVGVPPILRIRQDINGATGLSNNTPDNYADDRIVGYRFDVATGQIDYEGIDILTRGFVQEPGFPFSVRAGVVVNGGVEINNLTIRLDPALPVDPSTNPQASTIDTTGSRTVYFYSLSHSWQ